MEFFSVILFLLTLGVFSLYIINFSRFKIIIIICVIGLASAAYYWGLVYEYPDQGFIELSKDAIVRGTTILRGIQVAPLLARFSDDDLFKYTTYMIHIMGILLTYFLVVSIFVKEFFLKAKTSWFKLQNHIIVFGDDENVNYFMDSLEHEIDQGKLKSSIPTIIRVFPTAYNRDKEFKRKYRFQYGIALFDIDSMDLSKLINKDSQKEIKIISLLSQDQMVLELVSKITQMNKDYPSLNLTSYILCDNNEKLHTYETFTSHSNKVQFFSYHLLVARRFVMDNTFINPETLTDKSKIQFNFVGYGETNQEIYKHLFTTNQFPPKAQGLMGIIRKGTIDPVAYQIFANEGKELVPTFNLELGTEKTNEFPVPELSQNTDFCKSEMSGSDLTDRFDERSINQNSFNFFIVALESDVTNLKVALKISEYLKKRQLTGKATIFVQLLNDQYRKSSSLFQESFIRPFGIGKEIFSLHQIVHPDFLMIAKRIHLGQETPTPWELLSSQEQDALLYEAIAIRVKLNMMGFDLSTEGQGISKEDYFNSYDPNHPEILPRKFIKADNEKALDGYFSDRSSKRFVLAQQEQLRWVAFRLTQGWARMDKETMRNLSNFLGEKNDGRLTTLEGMRNLIIFLHTEFGFNIREIDFISSRFFMMDNLFSLLEGTPYVIIPYKKAMNEPTRLPIKRAKPKTSILSKMKVGAK